MPASQRRHHLIHEHPRLVPEGRAAGEMPIMLWCCWDWDKPYQQSNQHAAAEEMYRKAQEFMKKRRQGQ